MIDIFKAVTCFIKLFHGRSCFNNDLRSARDIYLSVFENISVRLKAVKCGYATK